MSDRGGALRRFGSFRLRLSPDWTSSFEPNWQGRNGAPAGLQGLWLSL